LKKEADIAVGNVVGSNIFNILGILGISAAVTPLSSSGITGIDLGVMAAFALALWIFSRTGYRITRMEGVVMLAAYAAYVVWLVGRV
jgi:cation:H+ antiporter